MQIKKNNNMQIPQIGNNADLFQRLSEYVSKFDKRWIEKIKPASNSSIDLLKEISEMQKWSKDFPESYRIFLKNMGENDGGLLSKPLIGTTNITEIIDSYKEFHEFSPEVFDTPYLSFFQREMGGQLSFDLSEKCSQNILETDSGELLGINSESFEKLLFQSAFDQFERYNDIIGFSGSLNELKKEMSNYEIEDIFKIVDIVTENYGLDKAWFSDENHYIAFGEDISFCIQKRIGTTGFVTGNNRKLIKELVLDLTHKIGATKKKLVQLKIRKRL